MAEQTGSPKPKEKNTGLAIVAYIIFFIPLLTEAKKDPFVIYHVKQGLALLISWVIVMILNMALWRIPFFGWNLGWLLQIGLLILLIIGILNAANGEKKPLPIIGQLGEKFKF